MARIETGVDKLVLLVQKKKRISVDDASKELGVSPVIVQEWADFLEEEGTISIEYSLSKVFLIEKRFTKKEIEEKTKEYEDKKDAFIRKVEVAMQNLDAETKSFERIKDEFLKLKEGLGGEMDKIQGELASIHHFESLKKNIDEEIAKQRTDCNIVLQDAEKRIQGEQKKYDEVIAKLDREKSDLEKERGSLESIGKEEAALKERLDAMTKAVELIDKKMREEKNIIENAEKRIDTLEKFAIKVEEEVKRKKTDIITPLVEMAEQHRDKVMRLQDEIIDRLKQKKSDIETFSAQGREFAKRFEEFFRKKVEVEKLFTEIEANKDDLKREMESLISKARVFSVNKTDADMKKHIAELVKKYDDVQERKGMMKKNIEKLAILLKT